VNVEYSKVVILSEAKHLMPVASGDEVFRFTQDDWTHFDILSGG
jgi:hypothetical protein